MRNVARAAVAAVTIGGIAGIIPLTSARASAPVMPFSFLAPGFTQQLYATGVATFAFGIAFAPNGDPVTDGFGTLQRIDSHSTTTMDGSTIHPISTLPNSNGFFGIANTADGSLYVSASLQNSEPAKIDPTTGASVANSTGAPQAGCCGMTVDPVTNNLVYQSSQGISFVSPDLSTSGQFSSQSPDGIAFSPGGKYLFAAVGGGVAVIDRSGNLVQQIALTVGSGSDGMAFHSGDPEFLVTNNNDGTMTRMDFPNNDFSQPPTQSLFASGGSRGDLTDVGADGCLYVSQANTRFADGTTTQNASVVQICGGFIPPVPVKTTLVANPFVAQVLPGLDLYLTPGATLTAAGKPVPNEKITFTADKQAICSAITNSSGLAECAGLLTGVVPTLLNPLGYQASFAGDNAFQSSSGTGNILTVDGTKI